MSYTSSSEDSTSGDYPNQLRVKFEVYADANWDDYEEEFVLGDVEIDISNKEELTEDIIEDAQDYIEDHIKVRMNDSARYPCIEVSGILRCDDGFSHKKYEPETYLMGHVWWDK